MTTAELIARRRRARALVARADSRLGVAAISARVVCHGLRRRRRACSSTWRRGTGLPIDLFTLDTGLLFPETYALWRRLEERYGGHDPRGSAGADGRRAGRRARRSAVGARSRSLLRAAQGGSAGRGAARVRRLDHGDSPRSDATRAAARHVEWDAKNGLVKVNPLLRWSADDVWGYVKAHDVPYNALYDAGYASIGCAPCTTPVAPGEDPRAGRWRTREKNECGLHDQRCEACRSRT